MNADTIELRGGASGPGHFPGGQPVSGCAVRSQYAANYIWDNKLEGKLRGEWDALGTGMSWNDSRAEIQRGWNYSSRTI